MENPRKYYTALGIDVGRDALFVGAAVSPPQIVLGAYLRGLTTSSMAGTWQLATRLPNVGEWTRIEIGHEEEEGKYFLSLAVGGEHVGRREVTDPELKNPIDVKLKIGCRPGAAQGRTHPLPGFVRRVVVLQK